MQVRRVPIDSVAAALRDFWRQVFMTSETEMTLIVGHPETVVGETVAMGGEADMQYSH